MLIVMKFSPASCSSLPLRPEYLAPCSRTPSVCVLPLLTGKTKQQRNYILHILICGLWDC
jgi:hypothetical protein